MKTLAQWKNKSLYTSNLLYKVQQALHSVVPDADIILFGSRVRNEAQKNSDWDFLILVGQTIDKKSKLEIKDCLYDIELEYNEILSSIIRTKQEWNSPRYSVLPLKKIIENEGMIL